MTYAAPELNGIGRDLDNIVRVTASAVQVTENGEKT
jgi:hypothetical protein